MMERRLRAREWCLIAAAGIAAAASAAAAVACGGPGNSGQTTIDASLEEAVPWTNGGVPVLVDGSPIVPATLSYPPIATGMADPGSRQLDDAGVAQLCSVLAGIQTSDNGYYDSFEGAPQLGDAGLGVAIAWTGFDDLTRGSFHVPGDVTFYSGYRQPQNSQSPNIDCFNPRCDMGSYVWGLAADNVGGPSCNGVPNNFSLHYRGGLFTNWGGGVSSVFTDPVSLPGTPLCRPEDAGVCPPTPPDGSIVDTAGLPTHATDGGPYEQSHAFMDASAWDGIGFWARTGPEGNPQLILTITDNFTSDRLARQNNKYCTRLRKCYTHCLNYVPCTLQPDNNSNPPSAAGVYRCYDPDSGPFPENGSGVANVPAALTDLLYPRCGPSACTSPGTYKDWDFDGKECRPYTFPAADYSAEYCLNPGDPNPPDRDNQCLDGWARAVTLTTDWKYYTVPFSDLRQGGFGKVAPYFNTKAIDTIAFTIIVGWADFYLDNVSFYRNKH
jgi:hypothetical protein